MKKLQNSLIIFIICVLAKTAAGQTMPLIPWLSGDQYGIANEAGQILIQPQYEDVAVFQDCPLALVKKGGLWGVVDGKGNMLIPPVIQGEITSQHTSFAGVKIMPAFKRNSILESATFEKSNLYCIVDPTARKLYYVNPNFPQKSYAAFLDPKKSPDGEHYQVPSHLDIGLIRVITPDTMINFIDTTGRLIFEQGSERAYAKSKKVIVVEDESGKMQAFNTAGKKIIDRVYDKIVVYEDRYIVGGVEGTSGYDKPQSDLFTDLGHVIMEQQVVSPYVKNGLMVTYDSNIANLHTLEGKIISTFPDAKLMLFEWSPGRVQILIKGKIGLLYRNGKYVFEPRYSSLFAFNDRLYSFEDDARGGLVTSDGVELWSRDSVRISQSIYPSGYYSFATRSSNYPNYVQGVIDSTGKVIVEYAMQQITYKELWKSFLVQRGDSIMVVRLNGEIVFPWKSPVSQHSFDGHQISIAYQGELYSYGKDFKFISKTPIHEPIPSKVTVKYTGEQYTLLDAEGKSMKDDRFASFGDFREFLTRRKVYFVRHLEASDDTVLLYDDHGRRLEPPGYIMSLRYAQSSPDDAGVIVLTHRGDWLAQKQNPRKGLIDGSGKWIIPPDTLRIGVIGSQLVVAFSPKETMVKTYNRHGRLLHERPYHYFFRRTDEGIQAGKIVVGLKPNLPVYEQYLRENNLAYIKERLALYSASNMLPAYMVGCIDTLGREVLPVKYVEINPLYGDDFCAKEISATGMLESVVINGAGKVILRTPLNIIKYEGKSHFLFKQNGKVGLCNLEGSIILPAKYESINFVDSNEEIIMSTDSVNVYVLRIDAIDRPTYIGPNQYPKMEKFGSTSYKSIVEFRKGSDKMMQVNFFDQAGKFIHSLEAHKVESSYKKQPLPEGWIAVQETPLSKFHVQNYITGKKYKTD